MANDKSHRTLLNILKVIISLALIALILLKTDLNNLAFILRSVHFGYFLLAAALMLLEILSMTYRLQVLIAVKSMNIPYAVLFKFNVMGVFVGNFLPSKLGIDGLRTYYLAKHTSQTMDSITSITLDRYINLIVITVFAMFSYILGGYYIRFPALGLIILIMVLSISLSAVLLHRRISRWLEKRLTDRKWTGSLIQFIHDLAISFEQSKRHYKSLVFIVFLSVLFQINRICTTYFFARSVHIDVHIGYYFLVTPIMILMGMLPLSVAGIGITQFTTVQMFKLVGVEIESSLGLAMLIYFTRILIALPGFYFFYREGVNTLIDSITHIRDRFSNRNDK
jgi:uncharacterized protein (TIRG00374 family)